MARKTVDQAIEPRNVEARRPIKIRQGENAMLTFAGATDTNLDPFYEAIVELLLERLEQLSQNKKEN
jgi:hypothetical protein